MYVLSCHPPVGLFISTCHFTCQHHVCTLSRKHLYSVHNWGVYWPECPHSLFNCLNIWPKRWGVHAMHGIESPITVNWKMSLILKFLQMIMILAVIWWGSRKCFLNQFVKLKVSQEIPSTISPARPPASWEAQLGLRPNIISAKANAQWGRARPVEYVRFGFVQPITLSPPRSPQCF